MSEREEQAMNQVKQAMAKLDGSGKQAAAAIVTAYAAGKEAGTGTKETTADA